MTIKSTSEVDRFVVDNSTSTSVAKDPKNFDAQNFETESADLETLSPTQIDDTFFSQEQQRRRRQVEDELQRGREFYQFRQHCGTAKEFARRLALHGYSVNAARRAQRFYLTYRDYPIEEVSKINLDLLSRLASGRYQDLLTRLKTISDWNDQSLEGWMKEEREKQAVVLQEARAALAENAACDSVEIYDSDARQCLTQQCEQENLPAPTIVANALKLYDAWRQIQQTKQQVVNRLQSIYEYVTHAASWEEFAQVTASDADLLVEILKTCSAEYRQQLVEMVASYLDEHPLRLSHLDWVPTELLIPSILHSRILQS